MVDEGRDALVVSNGTGVVDWDRVTATNSFSVKLSFGELSVVVVVVLNWDESIRFGNDVLARKWLFWC